MYYVASSLKLSGNDVQNYYRSILSLLMQPRSLPLISIVLPSRNVRDEHDIPKGIEAVLFLDGMVIEV
jgi:hypothetical protein